MRHSLKSALAGITLLGASLIPGYFAFNRKFNPEKPKARIEAAKQSIDKQLVEELRDDSIPGYDLVRLDFSRSEQPHASGDMPAGGNGAYIHYYPNPTTGKRDIYVEVYDNEHLDKAASDTLRDFLGGALPQPSDMATMSEEDRVRACNQNLVDAIHAKGTKIVGENGQEYNMFEIGGCILLLIGGAVCLGYARKQRRKEKKPLAVEEEIVETDNLLAQEIGQVTLDFNTLYESIQQKLEGSVRDAMIMKIDFKAIKVRLSSSLSNFMDALQSMESNHNDKTPINIDLQKLKDEFANLQNIQADINILFSEGMKKEITVGMVLLEERFQTLETLMESPTALASSNFDIPQTQAFIAGQRQIIADWDNGNGMNYQGDAYTKYTAYQPILESLTIALQTVNQKVADINSLLSQPAEPAEEQPAEELEELVAEPPVAEELEELPQVPVTETRETLLARLSSTPIDQIDDMDELKDVVTGIATQIKAMLDAIQSASDSLDDTKYDPYRQSTQEFLDIQTKRYAHRETEFMFIEQCKEYIVGDLQSFFMDVYEKKVLFDTFVQEEKAEAAKKPATDSKKPADVADLPPPPPPLLDDGGIAEITVVPEAPVTVEAVEAGGTRVATLDALYGDLDEDGRHIKAIFRRLFPDTQQDILSEDALKKLFDGDDSLYQEYKSFAFNYYTLNKNYFTSLLQPCIQIYKSARDVLNNKDSYQNDFKTWLKKSRPTSLHPLGEVYCNVWQHLPNVSIDNDVLHLPDNISIGDLSNFMYGTGRDDRNVVWHFNHDKNPPEMLCPGIRVPQIPLALQQFLISKGLQSSLDALQPIFDAGKVVSPEVVETLNDTTVSSIDFYAGGKTKEEVSKNLGEKGFNTDDFGWTEEVGLRYVTKGEGDAKRYYICNRRDGRIIPALSPIPSGSIVKVVHNDVVWVKEPSKSSFSLYNTEGKEVYSGDMEKNRCSFHSSDHGFLNGVFIAMAIINDSSVTVQEMLADTGDRMDFPEHVFDCPDFSSYKDFHLTKENDGSAYLILTDDQNQQVLINQKGEMLLKARDIERLHDADGEKKTGYVTYNPTEIYQWIAGSLVKLDKEVNPLSQTGETTPQIKEIPLEQLSQSLHAIMKSFLVSQKINDFTLALDAVDPKNLGSLSFTITTENEVGFGKLTGKKTLQTIKVTITNDSLKNGKLSSLRTEGLPDKSIGSLRSMLSSTTGTGLIADLKNTDRGINGDLLIRDGKLSISTSSAGSSGGSVESNTPLSPEAGDGQGGGDETGDGGELPVDFIQAAEITEAAGGTLLTDGLSRNIFFTQHGLDFNRSITTTTNLIQGFAEKMLNGVSHKYVTPQPDVTYTATIAGRTIKFEVSQGFNFVPGGQIGSINVKWWTQGSVMSKVLSDEKASIDEAIGELIHYRYQSVE